MNTVLSPSRTQPRELPSFDARELSRKLDLIEDRSGSALTWSDVARHARSLWRRLETAPRRR